MSAILHNPVCWTLRKLSVSGKALRVLLVSLLVTTCCFIILYTIVETHTLWRKSKQVQSHELANKRYSAAMATDVDNPLLHYSVVVDCGSSGSRVFVYFWPPHDGNPKELLNIQQMRDINADPVVMKIEPGISDFADRPEEVHSYMRPLLQYAAQYVPAEKHKETPLYIMATAGMRLLPESQQTAILTTLRTEIPREFHFLFAESHAEVITGKQEGIYAWIGINYALGKFNHIVGDEPVDVVSPPGSHDARHVRKRTVGMLDMGGGSMQVAFEVPKSVSFIAPKEDMAKSLIAEFNLGCTESDMDHTYRVYVTTFLGFGGNMARERYEQMIVNMTKTKANSTESKSGRTESLAFVDPCLPLDMMDYTLVGDTHYYFQGSGEFTLCEQSIRPLLRRDAPCAKQPCSMDGMFQPEINFANSEFYGFSEFYYSMEDVLRMAGKYDYVKFVKAAKEYCSTPWSTLRDWYDKKLYPKADERRFRLQCFKSAWMAAVLHEGLGFPRTYRHLTSTQLLEGREVQWTLGALVYKTRYFPLRELDSAQLAAHHRSNYRPPWTLEEQHTYYVVVGCVLIVVAAILLYLRRLRVVRRSLGGLSTPLGDMRRVPTMSYFMTEPDQTQEGIRHGYQDSLPYMGVS